MYIGYRIIVVNSMTFVLLEENEYAANDMIEIQMNKIDLSEIFFFILQNKLL